MIVFFLGIIITLYLIIIYKYRTIHPFFYEQDVHHYWLPYLNNGYISDESCNYSHKFNKEYIIQEWTDRKEFTNFLNNNYHPDYNFKSELSKDITLYKIEHDGVVGVSSSMPTDIVIENQKLNGYYLDHLTINKNHRGNYLTSDMFAHIINKTMHKGRKLYFIRKDGTPLPFKHFCCYNYYRIDDNIENHPPPVILRTDEISISNKYKIFIPLEKENKNYIYLGYRKNFGIVFYTNTMIDDKPVFEIGHIEGGNIEEKKILANMMTRYIYEKFKDSVVVVNNLGDTQSLFSRINYLSTSYLHFYNYVYPEVYPDEVFLCNN